MQVSAPCWTKDPGNTSEHASCHDVICCWSDRKDADSTRSLAKLK